MKTIIVSIFMAVITGLFVMTASWAETGVSPDPASVAKGLSLYEVNCITCHAKDGVGEKIPLGPLQPSTPPAMALNEESHAWHHGDNQLVQKIQRGNQRMPAFGQILSESEIRDLIAYMKSLWSDRILACQGPKHMSCM